ncbi:uncharacterized protein IL334_001894 [Kwoniella shivajii]|uniref:Uncharacterized protein n=1 Tax=Kwoniella shivajii TaxID=564305 RepID=A0ABZ1CTE4_9TREE|nr:hypothetical protein IL334_001894 [Kwoniella shivajii]
MESLSPECTPLKHRYDSCFNAWFEGYLQPALAASTSTSILTSPSPSTSTLPSLTPAPSTSTVDATSSSSPASPSESVRVTPKVEPRKPLITSWASAFPSRRPKKVKQRSKSPINNQPSQIGQEQEVEEEHHWYDFVLPEESEVDADTITDQEMAQGQEEVIDTKGKTRSQIKAEEYQRNCGRFWDDYQGCLKKAIAQNESLSTLLETAREEHPLGSLDGLKGTPWDSKADFTKEDQD